MGAPTEVYVDPAIAGNSGTGTIGDPYGDLQYALDTKARDSTNGDRFNVKAGTDEVLAAALTLATYGTPTETAPLILEGYTSTAGDGGIGGIDNNSYNLWTVGSYDSIRIKNMRIHNAGSNSVVTGDNNIYLINCEIYNTTGNGISIDDWGQVINCYVYDVGGYGVYLQKHGLCLYTRVKATTKTPSYCFRASDGRILFCEAYTKGSGSGILPGNAATIIGNSIWSDGGTGVGLDPTSHTHGVIANNIVVGFSGSGGKGIAISAYNHFAIGNNAFYNNATDISDSSAFTHNVLGTNQVLSESPFVDAANGDMRIKPGVARSLGWLQSRKATSFTDYRSFGAIQPLESMRRSRAVMIG